MEKVIHKHDVVEFKNFLTAEECQKLIDYFNSSIESWQETCFYASYVMDPLAPLSTNPNSEIDRSYFDSLRLSLKELAETCSPEKLRNLSLSAHKWTPGAFASDHSDNSDMDGTPNAWQDNKFVTIIYLNRDYEGGNLTFDAHGISIAPDQGTMIAFDPGFTNLHGVTEVLSGIRYTMLSSWDYESANYTEEDLKRIKEEKERLKPEQEKQRDEWRKGNKYV
jgi:hypothetical protein